MRVLALSVFCAAALWGGATHAQQPIKLPGTGGTLHATVQTYVDLRFKQIVRQAYDLSCGAAALATLLKHGWDVEVTEKEVIDEILETASEEPKAKIANAGFSMLELKRLGEKRGFTVAGFRLDDVEKLKALKVPAITLTNSRGYAHFVVIKGVRDGRVYIGDPAFGNRVRTLESFDTEWNNIILVFVPGDGNVSSGFQLKAGAASPTRELVVLLNPHLNTIRPLPGEF